MCFCDVLDFACFIHSEPKSSFIFSLILFRVSKNGDKEQQKKKRKRLLKVFALFAKMVVT